MPWVHGPGGIARDLVAGLRMRRHRIVGGGDNLWSMLGAEDAAAALVAALGAPPGVYSAAEPEIPTQLDVVRAVCAVPGHRMPDRVPPRLAALSMGGAMSEALGMNLAVRTGRLADHGVGAAPALARHDHSPGGDPPAYALRSTGMVRAATPCR